MTIIPGWSDWCDEHGHRFYATSMLTTVPQEVRCEWCGLTMGRDDVLVEVIRR